MGDDDDEGPGDAEIARVRQTGFLASSSNRTGKF